MRSIDGNVKVTPIQPAHVEQVEEDMNVTIGYRVFSVSDINAASSTFCADVLFFVSWIDTTLCRPDATCVQKGKNVGAWEGDHEDFVELGTELQPDWNETWSPVILCQNLSELHESEYLVQPLDVTQLSKEAIRFNIKLGGGGYRQRAYLADPKIGKVVLEKRLRGTFRQPLDLHDFPFDTQSLQIVLSEQEHGCAPFRSVNFALQDAGGWKYRNTISQRVGDMMPEWEVHYPFDLAEANNTFTASQHPTYTLTLPVRRKAGFYIWNIMIPFSLISGLTLTCFALPPEEINDRLTIVMTMILTAVAFKFVASQGLPPISYLTFLDKYVLIMLFGMFLLGIEVTVVPRLFENDNTLRSVDAKIFWILLCVYICLHVYLARWMFVTYHKGVRLMSASDQLWQGKDTLMRKSTIKRRNS
mmetsp:Transcript_12914/g.19421  ORF Transcript_12914/g.19421 Transcript_12914/m.19421 type:complete len:416 (+) Transcript_12914:283-1530(+)